VAYRIEFYNPKVAADVRGWPAGIAASFAVIAVRMVEHGPNLGMPHTRALGGGLYEVRARGAEGIGRALFCTVVGQRIVVLHGFIKKSQAAPAAELRIARKRMKEVQDG
jgi:phage-related protein